MNSPPRPAAEAKSPLVWAALVAMGYFVLACCLMGDYGPTWDVCMGGYPYGDEVVAYWGSDATDFVEVAEANAAPDVRQPYPDFYKNQFPWYEVYPFAGTLAAVSSWLLWDCTGLVSAIAAHQIVIPMLVAILLAAMVWFLARRAGLAAGVGAVALMLASPRFLAHSINNLKDMPECVLYTLATLAAFRALTERGVLAWVLTGVLTALALAQKANALFLPFHVLVFFLLTLCLRSRGTADSAAVRIRWSGFGLAALSFLIVYFAVSPAFWHEPLERLGKHFGQIQKVGALAEIEDLLPGETAWMARLSGPLNVLVTTPLPVLVLAVLGLFRAHASRLLKLFLLVGACFPVARVLMPGARDFDGVRHFLEFYPCLCGLAGLGVCWVFQVLSRVPTRVLACLLLLAPGVIAVIGTYPFGTCYFNSLTGGLAGAQRRGIPQATDYWANSYWQGLGWLNRNAGENAALLVPIAPQVVVTAAPVRLRPDIRVQPGAVADCPGSLYVMHVTRRLFYDELLHHLESHGNPAHQVEVQGGVILRIYRLSSTADKSEAFRLVAETGRQRALRAALFGWIRESDANRDKMRVILHQAWSRGARAGSVPLRQALPMLSETDAVKLLNWINRRRR